MRPLVHVFCRLLNYIECSLQVHTAQNLVQHPPTGLLVRGLLHPKRSYIGDQTVHVNVYIIEL